MTLAECAAFMGQSKRTISKWTKKAGLPFSQVEGGKLMFNLELVDKWLKDKTNYVKGKGKQ